MPHPSPRIAILLPCYNEGLTIGELVLQFRQVLPSATIYVYDNNSTDNTAEAASTAGAVVRTEMLQGKGNVIRRAFADIDADIYVMADGDLTYDPKDAPALVEQLQNQNLDMVVGVRDTTDKSAFPTGHFFGNRLFNLIVRHIFGRGFQDVFSGYRVFNRRYVKSFPAHSSGFETETEMCIHALDLRLAFQEMPVSYRSRPEGSTSKLNSLRDGMRILMTILQLFKEVRPLLFFNLVAGLFLLAGLALGWGVVEEWYKTGLVMRIPSAILATGLSLLAAISLICGVILDSVARNSREIKRLQYLQL